MSLCDKLFSNLCVILAGNSNGSIAKDGGYSNWSNFGPCSKTCGGGIQRRSRNCTMPVPQNGGKSCTVLGPSSETKICNIFPCLAG